MTGLISDSELKGTVGPWQRYAILVIAARISQLIIAIFSPLIDYFIHYIWQSVRKIITSCCFFMTELLISKQEQFIDLFQVVQTHSNRGARCGCLTICLSRRAEQDSRPTLPLCVSIRHRSTRLLFFFFFNHIKRI